MTDGTTDRATGGPAGGTAGGPRDAGGVVAVRVQDLVHGAGACVVVRRWPLATLVAYLFEGRECDDVRALLATGAGVARGSRLTWPPLALSAEDLTAIERTFPPARPERPLELSAVSAMVLHVPAGLAGAAGAERRAWREPGGALAIGRDEAAVRALAGRASYVRFDYGPWADLYSAQPSVEEAQAILAAARAPVSVDRDAELLVVRHPAGAAGAAGGTAEGDAPRLDFVSPRPDERAPWRELPP